MRSLVLATLTSLLLSGTAPLANVTEQDGPTRIHLGKRIFEIGGRGPDILEASTRRTELVGGRGFDLLLAPRGAARVALGADGGVAMANGRGGTEFTIGHGFSVVVGSPGSDTVHVWSGINLVFLRSGDDKVVAHDGGGLSIVFGGAGTDSVSCIGACWTTWTGPDIERRSRNDAPAPSSSLVVLGVPRTHRSLLELDPSRLSWMKLIARVFRVDISVCPRCSGHARHSGRHHSARHRRRVPRCRAAASCPCCRTTPAVLA